MYYQKRFDGHVHSDCSPRGVHSMMSLCEQAINRGLFGMAVTDCCDCDRFDEMQFSERVRESVYCVYKARSVFEGSLVISNGIIALAGALLCQYNGASDVTMGRGAIVIGLAAIIIGEVLFSKIARNFAVRLVCVVLGSVIYYLIMQVVTFGNIDSDDFKLISALIVAIFLAVPTIKEKFSKYFKTKKVTEVKENA